MMMMVMMMMVVMVEANISPQFSHVNGNRNSSQHLPTEVR